MLFRSWLPSLAWLMQGRCIPSECLEPQEVPPNSSVNTGTAIFELSDDESTLSYSIEVHKFDLGDVLTPAADDNIVGLHIHNAAPGANGPIVFGIFNPSHDTSRVITTMTDGTIRFAGAWDASDTDAANLADQLANLKNGQLYVNLHTNAFPGGEIRGQIVPEPSTSLLATLAFGGSLLSLRRRRRK